MANGEWGVEDGERRTGSVISVEDLSAHSRIFSVLPVLSVFSVVNQTRTRSKAGDRQRPVPQSSW